MEGRDGRLARAETHAEDQEGVTTRDWIEWHTGYDDDTPLLHRLRAVQRRIREALDDQPAGAIRVVSLCAGEGRDLLEVLTDHGRTPDVRGRLVELHPELAGRAAVRAPAGIDVRIGDAWGVGVQRFVGTPVPLAARQRLFTFVERDTGELPGIVSRSRRLPPPRPW